MLGRESVGERLPLWGGVECTVNRVGDSFFDQWNWSGHHERVCDLQRLADLGIEAARHAVLWERVCPKTFDEANWEHADRSLSGLREVGIQPIVGLLHHGSGPIYTSLIDPEFPEKLARYAGMVAERYPWVEAYTPVNEPLTTARFSGLYGHWYPHGTDVLSFARALLNEVKGTVLAMREIRKVNPSAQLVQTEDLGKTHSTERVRAQAEFENERRWITWDLLCGTFDPDGEVGRWLTRSGVAREELKWFRENPCPPDILGVNYYVTSERFLDHRIERYPECTHGGNGRIAYADTEAVRVLAGGIEGPKELLLETAERYGRTIAITECHLGCTREEQMRWVLYVYREAQAAKAAGADVRALTTWSVLGAYDWNTLLCKSVGHYEPGVFDMRSPMPRATGIASVIRSLAAGETPTHPLMQGSGWWERPIRLQYPPAIVSGKSRFDIAEAPSKIRAKAPPVLIVGAGGRLGRALSAACDIRGIRYVALTRAELELSQHNAVAEAVRAHRPWAVLNAAGTSDPQASELDPSGCFRDNMVAAMNLARACDEGGVRLLSFSCSQVFDGRKGAAYVESDPTRAVSTLGESKSEAERRILDATSDALIVRSGPLFGGVAAEPVIATTGALVSPTYVEDLVEAALDLFIDGETGIWHLANRGAVLDRDWQRMVLTQSFEAPDPGVSGPSFVLESERGWVMPTLEDAFARWTETTPSVAEEGIRAYFA